MSKQSNPNPKPVHFRFHVGQEVSGPFYGLGIIIKLFQDPATKEENALVRLRLQNRNEVCRLCEMIPLDEIRKELRNNRLS